MTICADLCEILHGFVSHGGLARTRTLTLHLDAEFSRPLHHSLHVQIFHRELRLLSFAWIVDLLVLAFFIYVLQAGILSEKSLRIVGDEFALYFLSFLQNAQ